MTAFDERFVSSSFYHLYKLKAGSIPQFDDFYECVVTEFKILSVLVSRIGMRIVMI
jgi:hypothetical protein